MCVGDRPVHYQWQLSILKANNLPVWHRWIFQYCQIILTFCKLNNECVTKDL